jgi:uncharacterized protein (TIGR02118 family)
MIQLQVLYPSGEGTTFNHDYFRDTHVPMALEAWDMSGATIIKGVNGPYVAGVTFVFESADALGAAMAAPGTGAVMADVANYTNITPIMQTSEVV